MKQRIVLFISILFSFGACSESSTKPEDNLNRVRLMTEAKEAVRPWLEHAPTQNGFFRTHFGLNWTPQKGNNRVWLTSQARLLYVLAKGYDLTRDERFRNAVRSGGKFLLTHMRDRKGGWHHIVNADGGPIRSNANKYAYSFVIFGLSHAYRVTGETTFRKAALETWRSGIWPGLVAARKLARSRSQNEFVGIQHPKNRFWSQNAFMHLFEALLALHDITDSPEIWSDIRAMARLMKDKMMRPCGCLPEWYEAATLSPQKNNKDGNVNLGHQVEWSFLLSRAIDKGLSSNYRTVAEGLLDFAIKHGVDQDNGNLQKTSDENGWVRGQGDWWWAQAEMMRATIYFAAKRGRADLWPIYKRAHTFVRIHYLDQQRGGWVQQSIVRNKTSSLRKVIGYHAVAFYAEALRVLAGNAKGP